MTDNSEVTSRIKLSLAECTVVNEQIRLAKAALDQVSGAVNGNRGAEIAARWSDATDAMNYINTILNIKGYAAMREYVKEQGDEDG